MNYITKIIISFIFLLILFMPVLSMAAVTYPTNGGLVPCGTERDPLVTDASGKQTGGEIKNPCDFNYLLQMINIIVDFVLFKILIPLAAIMFAYVGVLLLTSGGESSKKTKAKGIFWNVVWGIVIAAAAWLIIHTILTLLGFNGNAFGLQ